MASPISQEPRRKVYQRQAKYARYLQELADFNTAPDSSSTITHVKEEAKEEAKPSTLTRRSSRLSQKKRINYNDGKNYRVDYFGTQKLDPDLVISNKRIKLKSQQEHTVKTEQEEKPLPPPSAKGSKKIFCLLCRIHGRTNVESDPLNDTVASKPKEDDASKDPTIFNHSGGQFLPVLLPTGHHKKRKGNTDQMVTIGHVRASCLLRAPPARYQDIKPQGWWTEATECTHGYPSIIKNPKRFDSTQPGFVPYYVGFEEWMDEFAAYNYRMLLGSVRRFDDNKGPPYNFVGSTAACWRSDDRGSIGYARMVQNLTHQASSLSDPSQCLTPAESALWGAIVYRCFNRLSLFSRWAALKQVAAQPGEPKKISHPNNLAAYESIICMEDTAEENQAKGEINGKGKLQDQSRIWAIACSGVTLLGRSGYRDKWGKDFCEKQMSLGFDAMLCVAELPLPSEWKDFVKFCDWEKYQKGRGVMTGEHQVQAYVKVTAMIGKLANNNSSKLRAMSKAIMEATDAKIVLDKLKELDRVSDFFSWQIYSDLAGVQFHRQLYPDGTILPPSVVHDSRFRYGLYGPGARKGANIIFGQAKDQLALDRGVSQASTIPRAAKIRNEFSGALERTGLTQAWETAAKGREYDLETVEHSLCGFYGVLHNLAVKVLLADEKALPVIKEAARKKGCPWPPRLYSSSCISQRQDATSTWRPHPSTNLERQDLLNRCSLFVGEIKQEQQQK